MAILAKQIFQFLKLLNSDTGLNQLAAGVTCGFILGMTPTLSLQTIFVFLALFLFRIQIGAALVTSVFFAFAAFLLDPVFDTVGYWALSIESLTPIYTALYNAPILPFSRFNNTIVMGSAVVTILLSPFMFFAARWAISKYRVQIVERWRATKAWKFIKATAFYKWYLKCEELYNG